MGRLPAPPAEVPVERSMLGLAPQFRAAIERVLDRMRADGHDPLVFETLRTDERQAFIYGFGRTWDDGRGVVTHSESAADTWHGYGLAVDIVCNRTYWNASRQFWLSLGVAVRSEGLVWGADWNGNGRTDDERFVDRPHVQWGNGMRRSPSSNAQRLMASGGYQAVWHAVGAA